MSVLLMPLAFILLVLHEWGRQEDGPVPSVPWQMHFIVAGSLFGLLVLVVSESLSLVGRIDRPSMAVAWAAIAAVVGSIGWRRGTCARGLSRVTHLVASIRGLDLAFAIGFGGLTALILAVALASPPNNIDTLQYHMPRVEQWVQNRSLNHFPTAYESQNARPYWAELAILNLRLLWGSDQPANLPQALSLIGGALAASGIVGLLGGGGRAQWLGAAFAFSVPMAILQATVPKNDVVAGWWLLAFSFFVVLDIGGEVPPTYRLAHAASLGLATLTKGTVLPFLAPLLLWYGLDRLLRVGLRRSIGVMLPLGLVALAVNTPLWIRNIQTYGGLYGEIPVGMGPVPSVARVVAPQAHQALASLDKPDEAVQSAAPATIGLAGTLLVPTATAGGVSEQSYKILRMIAVHFVSPYKVFNDAYFRLLERYPEAFPPYFVSSLRDAQWNNDMTGGNPVHLVVIVLATVALAWRSRKLQSLGLGLMMASGYVGFLLMSFAGCADWIFCMRYQMGFFFLAAAPVALVGDWLAGKLTHLGTALLLVYAVPYVLINNMRPVIGLTPWPTRVGSVFLTDPVVVLFAQSPEIRDEYQALASRVVASGCLQVGLVTTRFDPEYTLWRLLGAPESGIVLRHLRGADASANDERSPFIPCAVICTACEEVDIPADLTLSADYGTIKLFLGGGE